MFGGGLYRQPLEKLYHYFTVSIPLFHLRNFKCPQHRLIVAISGQEPGFPGISDPLDLLLLFYLVFLKGLGFG